MINDVECNRTTRIIEITKCFGQHNPKKDNSWQGIFPEIEGDRVTFIGSSIVNNGEIIPYLKHCIATDTCDNIDDVTIEAYNTEKEALLAWTALVQRENPDIIICEHQNLKLHDSFDS